MTKRLSNVFENLLADPNDKKLWNSYIWQGPTQSDVASWQGQGYGVYQGKIRTILSRHGQLQLLHSDRLTAFDRLIDYVPLKGMILCAISDFWFRTLTGIVPTHYIKKIGARALLVEESRPIKVEVVVRAYLAGSLSRAYTAGHRTFCGVTLPNGLKPFDRLPEPIITPTTKAAAFEHDENITADELIGLGLCTKSEWDQVGAMALKVFSVGTNIFSNHGWILVDSKYEFGRFPDGSIRLIDEVHTPDSSRLWDAASCKKNADFGSEPKMFDKENVRRYLMAQGFSGFGEVPSVPRSILIDLGKNYLQVAETLIGQNLTYD